MITAYELYMRKQAGEFGGLGSVMHLADDIPMIYQHWAHGQQTGAPPQQPQQPAIGTGMSQHPVS